MKKRMKEKGKISKVETSVGGVYTTLKVGLSPEEMSNKSKQL